MRAFYLSGFLVCSTLVLWQQIAAGLSSSSNLFAFAALLFLLELTQGSRYLLRRPLIVSGMLLSGVVVALQLFWSLSTPGTWGLGSMALLEVLGATACLLMLAAMYWVRPTRAHSLRPTGAHFSS